MALVLCRRRIENGVNRWHAEVDVSPLLKRTASRRASSCHSITSHVLHSDVAAISSGT